MAMYRTGAQFPPPSSHAAREVRRNTPMRQARTCYDHLAGVVGVGLMDTLLQLEWLEGAGFRNGRAHYRLTATGQQALSARGVDVDLAGSARRMYAYGCLDWTERRLHLAGALAAVILRALEDTGTVRRLPGARTVTLLKPLACWLNGNPQNGE